MRKALVFAAVGFGNMDDEYQYTRSPAWEELVSTTSVISSSPDFQDDRHVCVFVAG